MGELRFECVDARPDRYAIAPLLLFRLRIAESDGEPVHAIALRCQIRVEPRRRRYAPAEEERLLDLFGEPSRWSETLNPFQFASVSHIVPAFTGSVELELPVPCTYDFEVAAAKYFHSLDSGEIPLLLLFSGTVFSHTQAGFTVQQIPWHHESAYRLPVAVWRDMMDLHFPNAAWIRLRRETLDALQRFKATRALTSWDQALEELLSGAKV
ncbi:MAG: DUF6084 family protein [Chloroflexota bacterium]|nr:DUF6084 family protein [Chloroflexota bacterium]